MNATIMSKIHTANSLWHAARGLPGRDILPNSALAGAEIVKLLSVSGIVAHFACVIGCARITVKATKGMMKRMSRLYVTA